MKAAKKVHRKKKRISKHVLKSQEERTKQQQGQKQEQEELNSISPFNDSTTTKNNHSTSPKKTTKINPKHVHTYLSTWQNYPSEWKFQKNTQSWMLRNMYQIEIIPKESFTILIGYLKGLKGNDIRKRVQTDAMRRALRYKGWEKTNTNEVTNKDNDEINQDKDNAAGNDDDNDNNDEEEERCWKALSDNDKRKEYKRARKVIDAMKVVD